MPSELRKRGQVMSAGATLSAICTCAGRPMPPILRTAAYRSVQHPKPQAEAPPAVWSPSSGNDRASTPAGFLSARRAGYSFPRSAMAGIGLPAGDADPAEMP
jgi:hypothetical protein